jgi:L-ascorbate metabolism protein UlaG (beta-lactamase superfamily)
MKIKYLGHSAFMLETDSMKALVDPFINGNPQANFDESDLRDITHIFVTHGHGDHIGDTVDIAKREGALVVCNFELGDYFTRKGLTVHTMHIGGRFDLGVCRVKMTIALHGSGISSVNGFIYGGTPCGFLIESEGKKVYHAGDTGLTMDMKLLERESIDIAMLPIGGNYTMDAEDAAIATEFIKPKMVIPMHYDTFPPIKADPIEFENRVKCADVKILKSGDVVEI